MIVREVEGVDRIGVGGRSRDIRVEEGRGVGPGRPDGGTVSVHGIAGDAAARRRPREGGACRGHAGGVEAGRGGGGHGRRAGNGVEDGAHRVPAAGGAKGGRPLLGARRARRDVLFERGAVGSLRPRRVRYAGAASGRHRAGRIAAQQGGEHQLARTYPGGRTGVDGRSLTARGDDLVQRAGDGDAGVVGDGALQVRGVGGGDGEGHSTRRRLAVLAVVQRDVPRVVQEVQRLGRPRPRAVHVVRYLNLPGDVVLREPPDQQIPAGDRAGERDRGRQDPRPGRECRPLDEGRGGRSGDGRGQKDSQGGHHGKANGARGRRQKFHGNLLLCRCEGGWTLRRIRFDAVWGRGCIQGN